MFSGRDGVRAAARVVLVQPVFPEQENTMIKLSTASLFLAASTTILEAASGA
jgi:hypothetical protein